jgi:XTP/dITP diphosphohydrolase
MKKIVFATNNIHKLAEVRALIPHWEIVSLQDIGCIEDIPETADTLEGNAHIKADYVTEKYGFNCFADDTGLEVVALNGDPGIYSARYAGESANSDDNIAKLLKSLEDKTNKDAQFRTVIALNLDGKKYEFDGICQGKILDKKQGESGFGYDPIFQPKGFAVSFAKMSQDQKGAISHRGKAVAKLIKFLNERKH